MVSFKKLQKAAEDAGVKGVPADRSVLSDLHTTTEGDTIGEGSVVQFIGFLIKSKFSNVGSGETVNCNLPAREENDIHVNIVPDKPPAEPTSKQLEDLEYQSVVAEVSPHFRPEQWEPLGRLVKTTPNATAAKKIAAMDLRRPMRFTGHLFFDGSHKPCTGTTPHGSSRRVSAWEIHPIYTIEVCINTSLSGCPRTDATKWQALHKWLEAQEEEGEEDKGEDK